MISSISTSFPYRTSAPLSRSSTAANPGSSQWEFVWGDDGNTEGDDDKKEIGDYHTYPRYPHSEDAEFNLIRNFGKGKYAREERRFGRDDRKFGRKEGGKHGDRRDDRCENKFSSRDGEGRKGKFGSDKFGKKNFDRKNNKSFNKFRRDDED